MARLNVPFNAMEHDVFGAGAGQLPVTVDKLGWLVQATGSTIKPVKEGEGGYIEFDLRIIEGEHAGRNGAYRINVFSTSEKVRKIAERQLATMAICCGFAGIQDTSQLHNIPFRVLVEPQEDSKYTQVRGIMDRNGNEAPAIKQAMLQNGAGAPPAGFGQPPAGFGQQQPAQQFQQPAQGSQQQFQQPVNTQQQQPAGPAGPAVGFGAGGFQQQPAQQFQQPAQGSQQQFQQPVNTQQQFQQPDWNKTN